jgi:5-methyltetrahydropteroyltriglutamate--homocysteine methyltransferase
VDHFRFLKAATRRTPKLCIPSPTLVHFRAGRDGIDRRTYPEPDAVFVDLAAAWRAEIADLAEAGCRYLQLDDTNFAYLCDAEMREAVHRIGWDPEMLPSAYAALINDAIRGRPADMVVTMHLCRGNLSGAWAAEGGYDPVAEELFNEIAVDGFFLEYDTPRAGSFAPLRFVPKGKTVVLGLVTTKSGKMEPKDGLKRRIDEAARHLTLDQLAISPQCGFASVAQGNDIDVAHETAKLRLVVEVASEVWG